ncbi:DUF1330 domain-containing protein [Actinomadura viridis]|uniref:DUF1330 domain-containing protein n=1 Tax=Actinomadura viridis TaxID=58110 RepID=UPI00367A243A
MTAHALPHLHPRPPFHDEVFTYIERIHESLDPFGGRFLVHGTGPEMLKGPLEGSHVVVEFPDMDKARSRYASKTSRRSCSRGPTASKGPSSRTRASLPITPPPARPYVWRRTPEFSFDPPTQAKKPALEEQRSSWSPTLPTLPTLPNFSTSGCVGRCCPQWSPSCRC